MNGDIRAASHSRDNFMQLKTYIEAGEWLTTHGLPSEGYEDIRARFPDYRAYPVPQDSGAKTFIAQRIVGTLFANRPVYLSVDNYDIWPSSANVPMFLRMREACRPDQTGDLNDYAVHLFGSDETDSLEYLFSLCMFFYFDATVMTPGEPFVLQLSHDERIDVHSERQHTEALHTFLTEVMA
jgi:hypothetical protein